MGVDYINRKYMNNLFDKTGVMALGTRLRILSEKVTKESEKIFELYNVNIKPKWYPIVYILLNNESRTVTQIAEEISYSKKRRQATKKKQRKKQKKKKKKKKNSRKKKKKKKKKK